MATSPFLCRVNSLPPPQLVNNLVEEHLRMPPSLDDASLNKFSEELGYEPTTTEFCKTLTEISKMIFGLLPTIYTGSLDTIAFLDHQSSCPDQFTDADESDDSKSDETLANFGKPKVIGACAGLLHQYNEMNSLRKKDTEPCVFPWHHVETVVERSPHNESDRYMAHLASYLTSVLTFRPDLIGVYGLLTTSTKYAIMWTDWTGSYKSRYYSWDSIKPLLAFMASLYLPPEAHSYHDKTVCLASGKGRFVAKPRWIFPRLFDKMTFKTIHIDPPYGRGARAYKEVCSDDEAPFIIKDVYLNVGEATKIETLDEAATLYKVHHLNGRPSPVRGIVRGVNLILPNLTTPTWRVGENGKDTKLARRKMRMLYFDSGTRIEYSDSVYESMSSMFDVLEVHRIAVQRGVLHRNIHPGSVYCKPKFMSSEKIEKHRSILPKNWQWLIAEPVQWVCLEEYLDLEAPSLPSGLLAGFRFACPFPHPGQSRSSAGTRDRS